MSRVILGSASPRRRELLAQIGITFEIMVSDAQENPRSSEPLEMVQELSLLKAEDVLQKISQAKQEDFLIIGADTLVAYRNTIMGKPKDTLDAVRMLTMLQGNTHQVYTGVTLIRKAGQKLLKKTFYEKTDVTMFPMSPQEIEAYVATGEPMDKAGAYGIQGKCAAYVQKIDGDYSNVVGLPVGRLYQEMKEIYWGIKLYD